ncbi:MAG: hypothetical protein R3362_10630, partial [Rhodothermales bacterium]|nr:hypothetical protein [Rhodothermales bacterium]
MLEAKETTAGLEARERTKEEAGQRPPVFGERDGVRPTRGLSQRARHRLFLLVLLGPTVVVVLAVVAFPFFYNVVLSLSNMNI